MRYRFFETDRVEFDYWIAPVQYGIDFFCESTDDYAYLKEIYDYASDDGIHSFPSGLFYFDTRDERTMFMLRWGCGSSSVSRSC